MSCSEFEIEEVFRSVTLYPDRVEKTFHYKENGCSYQKRLVKGCARRFLGIPLTRDITTVRNIETTPYKITAIQSRVRCGKANSDVQFFDFVGNVFTVNACGWVFGDLNFKNIVFDGEKYRIIDFEPFTCVVKNKVPQYRVTRPYFHSHDESTKSVSYLTDRIGLIGLYLRLNFGLKDSKYFFSKYIKEVSEACYLDLSQFINYLVNVKKNEL